MNIEKTYLIGGRLGGINIAADCTRRNGVCSSSKCFKRNIFIFGFNYLLYQYLVV
jgi:hypothetical protein